MRVLAQVTSSIACERCNSEALYVKPMQSNRMLPATMARVMRVHHNLNLAATVARDAYAQGYIGWEDECNSECYS